MGKLKGITINTDPAAEAHICAEDDAAIYQSIVGSDGVMMIGQQCESQVISNNKVRVKDGVIVVGGHFARIQYGDYIDCEIANGQSGRNRNDIIIAKFITTGTGGIDTYTLEVKQGASTTGSATDPTLTQNNLYESGKIREMPLYRVVIEGLSITKVEKMFESVPTIPMLNTYLSELQVQLAGSRMTQETRTFSARGSDGRNVYRTGSVEGHSKPNAYKIGKPRCLMAWKHSDRVIQLPHGSARNTNRDTTLFLPYRLHSIAPVSKAGHCCQCHWHQAERMKNPVACTS
ncbi:hypothetical protein [[Ruminococcus] torques]|uniref:hypothetical protein n=1 Tax=[Ruminococcus] torques TaxID=33039 RepID=UPI003522DB8E